MTPKIEHAIVLAAGLGKRLKPITDHSPKCLTEVNRTPILVNTLENLSAIGISNCTIVIGYLSEKIVQTIGKNFCGVNVHYIENSIYDSTNDMYSLWLACETLDKGAIIFEGDVFLRPDTLERALTSMGERSFYIAGRYNGKADEVIIKTDSKLLIRSIDVSWGRGKPPGNYTFMSSGILAVHSGYGKRLSKWLEDWVREKKVNFLFDDVLSQYVGSHSLWVYEIRWDEWVEIDTAEDLKRAEALFM
ncbi:MAG: phosphocholine cytidylyltransferase family protein [Spirochaetota bacterium]|nr:MAG: phosphocholine cytidylyltransferase family protein [Spirochaetota bacterium]